MKSLQMPPFERVRLHISVPATELLFASYTHYNKPEPFLIMLITIIPASTKSGTAVIRSILAAPNAGIAVQAVYRDTTRAPTEFTSMPNFAAVKGDIADKSSLNFKGSDAAIAITPPVFDRGDLVAIAQERSENVKNAIERSGTVNKVILLSSIGAQFSSGVGEIKTNNIAERVFAETNIAEVIFVRCAYFMENWTAAPETLRGPEPFFFSTVTPLEWKLPMVAVEDIGAVIASEALKQQGSPRKPHVFELHGPRMYSPLDVQLAFSDALGKQAGVPEDVVPEWVEMATSFLPGGVMKPGDVEEGTGVVNGKTELGDAIRSAVQRFLLSAVKGKDIDNGTALNPRWFPDLRTRITTCLASNPQTEERTRLERYLEYMDSKWLELSAGREGFLTEERWRGLNKFAVAWGDMDSMGTYESYLGHVNNIMYNRYAESGRVNWITSFAAHAPPEQRQQWLDMMSPRSIGFILKSIKTDYKLPVEYPDKITVIHKLAERPSHSSESIFLDAVIYSETHKRLAARCFEDIAVYNYKAGKRATLEGFMVEELQHVYDLQEKNKLRLSQQLDKLEQELKVIRGEA
ncbi:hypothetical protein ED733_008965 [Metarhizium rileyi]|uniref:NAD(P)-binding domain-containing protein n=1 Tax=Metarhizium rileyi (strain RCEF 4871) TaxID=1649241 RepID=A0A5C6GL07_METRR|nr:hypothetical protein ED733_008965 [Metarhizium rileyi]